MKALSVLALACSLAATNVVAAATFTIVNRDAGGVGMNDTTPFVPVGGNNATTMGAARLAVLQEAGRVWGAQLTSAVPIVVDANFGPLSCTANSGVLGSASPGSFASNFPGAPLPGVNYPIALANAIAGVRIGTSDDIFTSFNSSVGGANCLTGLKPYLGFDHVLPDGTYWDVLSTVLHEFGHGLGMASMTGSSGNTSFSSGLFSVYAQFMYSDALGKYWTNMTAAERAASVTSVASLVWNGTNVNSQLSLLTAGRSSPGGYLKLYAPSAYQPGSSVSHWDQSAQWTVAGAAQYLLMAPYQTPNPLGVTDFTGCALRDMGWQGTRCADSTGTIVNALLTAPTQGSELTATTTTFSWTAGIGATQYWFYIGNSQGAYDVYQANQGTNLSTTVSGLPTDGRKLYVRINSLIGGTWRYSDYTFVGGVTVPASLTAPTPGSTLTGATATFSWSEGSYPADAYLLAIAATNPILSGSTFSTTVSDLPIDGRTLNVTLWSHMSGTWYPRNYTFKAATLVALLTSPAASSTLAGSTATFSWSAGVGATRYWLYIGNTLGAYDVFQADQGTNLSTTITNLPTDGRTLYVRVYSLIAGSWQFVDYTFKAATAAAKLTSPTPGSTLTGATATFGWSPGIGATQYWLYIGNTLGAYDVYQANQGSNLSTTVSNLPTDGRRLYVRINSLIDGAWRFFDYTFSAATATKAALTSPAPGSTLASTSATFSWSAGTGVTQYWLYIGNTPGAYDVFQANQGTNLSTTVSNLPADGRTLYVRINSLINGAWQFNDYILAASVPAVKAALTSPAPGSTLTSASATFSWSPGSGVAGYWLYVGSAQGAQDLYTAGQGTNLSTTVSNLPTDGRTLYVRIHSYIAGAYQFNDYTFKAATFTAVLTSPTPGSTLPGATTTFTWSAGTGVTQYWLYIGSTQGTYDVYQANQGTNLLTIVSNLPTDGRTLYVRINSLIGGSWQFRDYSFKAASQ